MSASLAIPPMAEPTTGQTIKTQPEMESDFWEHFQAHETGSYETMMALVHDVIYARTHLEKAAFVAYKKNTVDASRTDGDTLNKNINAAEDPRITELQKTGLCPKVWSAIRTIHKMPQSAFDLALQNGKITDSVSVRSLKALSRIADAAELPIKQSDQRKRELTKAEAEKGSVAAADAAKGAIQTMDREASDAFVGAATRAHDALVDLRSSPPQRPADAESTDDHEHTDDPVGPEAEALQDQQHADFKSLYLEVQQTIKASRTEVASFETDLAEYVAALKLRHPKFAVTWRDKAA